MLSGWRAWRAAGFAVAALLLPVAPATGTVGAAEPSHAVVLLTGSSAQPVALTPRAALHESASKAHAGATVADHAALPSPATALVRSAGHRTGVPRAGVARSWTARAPPPAASTSTSRGSTP